MIAFTFDNKKYHGLQNARMIMLCEGMTWHKRGAKDNLDGLFES